MKFVATHTMLLQKKQTIQTKYLTIQLTTTTTLLCTRQKARQRTAHTAQTEDDNVERTSVPYTESNESSLLMWLQTREHRTFLFAIPTIYIAKI